MNAKSIFASKTLYLNIIALALTLAGYLPEEYAAPAIAILNVANRFLTSQPVTIP